METAERRADSAAEAVQAQRRYLTILFADVSNSTGIAETMDAEEYAELLASIQSTFERVIPRHGGMIVRMDGDGVAAVFGHPQPHEDDGRRATEAALEMHEQTEAATSFRDPARGPVRLHTGIHSGLVLLREGDVVRGRFEMLGDATNVASRLAAKARPGEILVSETTLGPERHFFRTGKLKLLRLRGKETPLAAFRIEGREAVTRRYDARLLRGVAPFAGRKRELVRLEHLLDAVMAGESRLAMILGAPGLGKTRLIGEFLAIARERGCTVLRADCETYLASEPSQPFRQLAQAAAGADGGADPTRQSEAIARAAAAGPVVVAVDDWQWADSIANQAMQTLRGRATRNLMIVLGAREMRAGDPALKDAVFLQLVPLEEGESREAVANLLPGSDPFLRKRIHEHAGGNPLFIEELCHSVASSGEWRVATSKSAWLDALVQARLERLPADVADIARVASVIGVSVPLWLLETLTGGAACAGRLELLSSADFIYADDRPGMLRFKHGVTRDVIYASVGLRERRLLHLRIAEELQRRTDDPADETPIEALAYHCRAGGDLAAAARFAEQAGDRAQRATALDRAQDQYRVALECLDGLEESIQVDKNWNRLVQKLAMATIFDPSHAHLPIFIRAADRAAARGDLASLAWAEHRLGYVNFALGERRDAILHCERALEAASALGNDKLSARIRETLGQANVTTAAYLRALPLLDEAIEARRRNAGNFPQSGLAYSLATKGLALGDMGRFPEAHACFQEAASRIRDVRHEVEVSVYSSWAAVCLWQGLETDAFHYAQRAGEFAERARARYIFSMCRALAGYAQWRLTGDEAAIETMLDATAWLFEERDARQYTSLCHGWLADALVDVGRFERARNHATRTLWRARKLDRLGEAMACRAMARAAAAGFGHRSPDHYLALARRAGEARRSAHEAARTQLCEAQIGPADAKAISLPLARARFAELAIRWPEGSGL